MDIKHLQKVLSEFADERDWDQYHNPKNLAMALSVEASELVEIFQWLTAEQSADIMNSSKSNHVRDEVADILIYLLRLADKLDIDLDDAVNQKIVKNSSKYPAGTEGGVADFVVTESVTLDEDYLDIPAFQRLKNEAVSDLKQTQLETFNLDKRQVEEPLIIGVGGAGLNFLEAIVDQNFDRLYVDTEKLRSIGELPFIYLEKSHALLKSLLSDYIGDRSLVFIQGGLGGNTGTKLIPEIAQTAASNGKRVIAMVASPFEMEGNERVRDADAAIRRLQWMDGVELHTFENERLMQLDENQTLREAFGHADREFLQVMRRVISNTISC